VTGDSAAAQEGMRGGLCIIVRHVPMFPSRPVSEPVIVVSLSITVSLNGENS
jgi:hypothetical protein